MKFWGDADDDGTWATTTASFSIADPAEDLMDNVYLYDADGNITSIIDIRDQDSPTAQVFGYDDLNRLISVGTSTASINVIDETWSSSLTAAMARILSTARFMRPDLMAPSRMRVSADGAMRITRTSNSRSTMFQAQPVLPMQSFTFYNQNNTSYNDAKLLRITSPWDETTLSRSDNPSSTDLGMDWQVVPYGDWTVFDATDLVKAWKDGTYDNYGVKIIGQNTGGDDVKAFLTSNSTDEEHRPKLVVTRVLDTSNIPGITLGTTTQAAAYTYDAIGNIVSTTGKGSYAYAGTSFANPHAVTSIGSSTYSYDDDGNLTGVAGGPSYSWDYRNRLSDASVGSTAAYAYDYQNARVKKTSGGVATVYPNQFYQKTGAAVLKRIYLGSDLVASVLRYRHFNCDYFLLLCGSSRQYQIHDQCLRRDPGLL